jgi:hypothetical protein
MYRQRMLITVSDFEAWNQTIALVDEINKLSASKGWAQATLFTRTVGRFNELCLEFDFPDLATFQRETDEWNAEPGIGDIMRRIDAVRTEDPGYSELWEEATPVPLG